MHSIASMTFLGKQVLRKFEIMIFFRTQIDIPFSQRSNQGSFESSQKWSTIYIVENSGVIVKNRKR